MAAPTAHIAILSLEPPLVLEDNYCQGTVGGSSEYSICLSEGPRCTRVVGVVGVVGK